MLHNTLQLFVTNRCDRRCKGCFYASRLSSEDMPLADYRRHLDSHVGRLGISKVILLGGEPALHPRIAELVGEATGRGLDVTAYTNGCNLAAFPDDPKLTVRVGVLGLNYSEKPLALVRPSNLPVSVVYILRSDNVWELDATVAYAEEKFNCRYFMVSSIRDVEATGSYWTDTPDTIPNAEYKKIVEGFLGRYRGRLDVHVANRGVYGGCGHDHCRFLNIYPDGNCTLCPFDISLGILDDPKDFGRKCNKHTECLLQKWVRPSQPCCATPA